MLTLQSAPGGEFVLGKVKQWIAAHLRQASDSSQRTRITIGETFKFEAPPPRIPESDHLSDDPLFVPRRIEETDKIREQLRASRLSRRLLADEKYVDFQQADRARALMDADRSAAGMVRATFAINAGSILAMLTFIGSLYARSDPKLFDSLRQLSKEIGDGMHMFGAGIAASMFAGMFKYLLSTMDALTSVGPANARRMLLWAPRYKGLKLDKHATLLNLVFFKACLFAAIVFWIIGSRNVLTAFQNFSAFK